MPSRPSTRVFVSFDYNHDLDLKTLLVGQSRHPRSPFSVHDWSVKQSSRGWKTDARSRIRRSACLIAICGYYTDQAVGVTAEIAIARDEATPVYLLRGRKAGRVSRPKGTSIFTTIHPWTWDNLLAMTIGRA